MEETMKIKKIGGEMEKRMIKFIIFLLIVFSTGLLLAQTNVEGDVSGTWITANSPYNVIGDLEVPNGQTLTIEPGVSVEFMDYYSFTIYGKLVAIGTENDSILFTSGQMTPNPDDWEYIKFEDSSDDNSIISYAKIEYANYGIWCDSSSPSISNNTISNNYYYGILCKYSSSPSISNNTISNNNYYGISCSYYSSPSISNNTISNNNYSGIYCYYSSSPSISNNTISNNSSRGIYCYSSSPSISNNTISNNSSRGIYCSHSSPSISNNTISNNNYGIYCYYSSSSISNNTISNNNDDGILCEYYSSPSILNNILYDNSTGIYAESSPASLEYNLFYLNNTAGSGNLPSYFGNIITVNANGDSCDTYCNLFMNPLFVDSLDFHLTASSPCIDAGDPTSPLDPDSTFADMGAFYFDQLNEIYDNEIQLVGFHLSNFPNPFNPTTTISYQLPENSEVELAIYNLKGQKVKQLVSNSAGQLSAGQHSVVWNGKDDNGKSVSSGIYFYKLKTGNYEQTRKMILIK